MRKSGKVWAVGMMKDEADVAASVLWHLVTEGVDGIMVADNNSTDGTKDILLDVQAELEGTCEIAIVEDHEVAYYQSHKMSQWADYVARTFDAEWIVPFDADEIWYSPERPLAEILRMSAGTVVPAYIINHFATAEDEDSDIPFESMVWSEPEPQELPKVAFRWSKGATIHQGNHGVSFAPGIRHLETGNLFLRHFPYRSPEHFVRKAVNGAAAYKETVLPKDMGIHWREYGKTYEEHGAEELVRHYNECFFYEDPEDAGLVRNPAPFMRW